MHNARLAYAHSNRPSKLSPWFYIDPKILSSLVWWIKRFCSFRSRSASTRFCPWNPWNWANHRFRWFVVIHVLQDPYDIMTQMWVVAFQQERFLKVNCKQTCPCKTCWLLHRPQEWKNDIRSPPCCENGSYVHIFVSAYLIPCGIHRLICTHILGSLDAPWIKLCVDTPSKSLGTPKI